MIQSYINTITTLTSNDSSVVFQEDCIRTRSCQGNGWLCHNRGSANYDIVCGGLYEIDFNATVSSTTTGVLAFALFSNGEEIPSTRMIETIAATDDYANIGINKKIKVCCNGDANISVRAIPVVLTPSDPTTPIDTVDSPIIASANFSITRLK